MFEELIKKAGEYFLCARHMNLRGASDVLKECKPLIEALKKEIIDLIPRPRVFGGGTNDAGVKFSLARSVQNVTPTGLINGSNVTYTVPSTIHAVLSFGINGMVIHSSDFSFSNKTITFTTALPAELSGTRFEIVYV